MKKIANSGAIAIILAAVLCPTANAQMLSTIPVQQLPTNPQPVSTEKPFVALLSNVDVTVGGFIKFDALYSDFTRGDALTANGRDFYVPASIPVGAANNSQNSLDFHGKETRLFIKSELALSDDIKIGSYVEFDFLVNPGTATAAVTNAYNPGLRRAYLTYGSFLVGQEWTTFQNLAALPEGLDFIGPTESTVFGRQPQLRYTWGNWLFSLENPETSLLARGGATRTLTDDNVLPDIVIRHDFKGDFGVVSVSGLGRQLRSRISSPATLASNDTTLAGGLSVAGKINVGADDVRFSLSGGRGVGRYIGINTATDSVVDSDANVKAIPLFAAYVAYRHVWTPKLRSTITASVLNVNNETALTGTAATRRVDSYHINLLYSPVKPLTFGIEGMSARRESESQYGYLRRVQVSAKYAF